jgi:hypothetical protein
MTLLYVKALALTGLIHVAAKAQQGKDSNIPTAVKTALKQQYPTAAKVGWEKEKGNFEANWGGASKEDTSVLYTPAGVFVEVVVAIPIAQLPTKVTAYVHAQYPGTRIKEAGKITTADGSTQFEAEIKGKDLRFDDKGNFLRVD